MRLATWIRSSGRTCPPGWMLSRAVSEGATPALKEHLEQCERCAAELQGLCGFSERARRLPGAGLSAEARERIASALLAQGTRADKRLLDRRPRRLVWAAAGAAAMVLVGLGTWGWWSRPVATRTAETEIQSHAGLRVIGAASFARVQLPPDEIVRLDSGTIEVEVRPLAAGQRFRVVTGDSEVEVRGTAFGVTAQEQRLLSVRVFHGQVEVRPGGRGAMLLGSGDQWVSAPESAGAVALGAMADAPEPAPPPLPPRPRKANRTSTLRALATLPQRAPSAPPPEEAPAAKDNRVPSGPSFERGWQHLRQRDYAAAAAAFAKLESDAHGDEIAEDAMFWRGVALARGRETAAARAVFTSFLARHPKSPRLGEVSAVLGWMLLEAGDRPSARRLFERAARDPVERVRASGRTGLQQIEVLEE